MELEVKEAAVVFFITVDRVRQGCLALQSGVDSGLTH